MAMFDIGSTDEFLKDFQFVEENAEKIFGEMTKAGAEVAKKNIESNVPVSEMKSHVKLSKTYKTPSDGGINTKVYFSGYLPFKGNRKYFTRSGGNGKTYKTSKGIPAEFLAIVFEYGRSGAPFPKKPFFRNAFKRGEIEKAMIEAQKTESKGLLDE